ncbi:MAG: DUF2332 domain-containing protein [Myxococcota bacterium]
MNEPSARDGEILAMFRKQAETCAAMDSAIYGDLLGRCADDFAAGGRVARALAGWVGHPVLDNVPLRLLGAAHFLALRGDAPALAACLPSAGGNYDAARAWAALQATLELHEARIRVHLTEQIQTNEVRRCCALLGGFLEIARAQPWPLRLLEIGASAGLNQCFEQFRYELGAQRFGPADAPLTLDCEWRGRPLDTRGPALRIASRKGCDLFPIDLREREQRLRLESFFWPDHAERLARLRAACECALRSGVALERASAGDWIAREVATLPERTTSVLFHSVMWLYVSEAERKRIRGLMSDAGARASAEAPLAWLRVESANFDWCEIRLRCWPGGEDRLLGRAHHHGAWVEWLAE